MSMELLIISALGVLILGLYFYIKSRGDGKHVKHVVVKDAEAELLYKQHKQKPEKKLSLKERIDLSWQFLYDISEIVLNKFSMADRQAVKDVGQKLHNAGMKYEHVVEFGIRPEARKTPVIDMEQEKNQGQSR